MFNYGGICWLVPSSSAPFNVSALFWLWTLLALVFMRSLAFDVSFGFLNALQQHPDLTIVVIVKRGYANQSIAAD